MEGEEVNSGRVQQRILWLLRYLERQDGFCVAWDEEAVDAFVKAFPETNKTLRIYLMGANSSPMLNDTAKRAKLAGYIQAGHIGNQDARSYNKRTWCRTWNLTPLGRQELKKGATE